MSDQAIGETSGTTPAAFVRGSATSIIDRDKPLDLEEVMSSARRPERTARILMRPDLLADLDEIENQLEDRHNANLHAGKEDTLADDKLQDLAQQAEDIRAELASSQRSIRVRAMPKDEWATFVKAHTKDGSDELDDDFWTELISKCAIRPEMTKDQVEQLRNKLGQPAIDNISTAAWRANTADGLDIPKSRLSSRILAPRESS